MYRNNSSKNVSVVIGALLFVLLMGWVAIPVVVYFAWSLVAVPIFSAPDLTFIQVWLCTVVLVTVVNLLKGKS